MNIEEANKAIELRQTQERSFSSTMDSTQLRRRFPPIRNTRVIIDSGRPTREVLRQHDRQIRLVPFRADRSSRDQGRREESMDCGAAGRDWDETSKARFATPLRSTARFSEVASEGRRAAPANDLGIHLTYQDFIRKIPRKNVKIVKLSPPVTSYNNENNGKKPNSADNNVSGARYLSVKASQVTTIAASECALNPPVNDLYTYDPESIKLAYRSPVSDPVTLRTAKPSSSPSSPPQYQQQPPGEEDVPAKPIFESAESEEEECSLPPDVGQDVPIVWLEESTYIVDCDRDEEKYQQRADVLLKPYANRVILQRSVYRSRPDTVFFQYPRCAARVRPMERTYIAYQEELGNQYLGFSVSDNTTVYKCVCKALKYAGFRLGKGTTWNVLWTGSARNEIVGALRSQQKANHFPGICQLGRKDNLWRNINRLKRIHGKEYNICPTTFVFPEDFARFMHEKDTGDSQIWILKPQASSCGRGIKLLGPGNNVAINE